jgi:outer membrane immunogenic protein
MRAVLSIAPLAAALVSGSLAAVAADLPARPQYKEPVMVAPVTPWTSCYIGGNVGAAWRSGEITGPAGGLASSTSNAGFVGGAQIGCDYQAGSMVFGIRNIADWSNNLGASSAFAGGTINVENNWLDLIQARFGYAMQPSWLVYVAGGGAWTSGTAKQFDGAGAQIGQVSGNRAGWSVGVGSEYLFTPHWSAFLEFDYADFGSKTVSLPVGSSSTVGLKASMVVLGANYRF